MKPKGGKLFAAFIDFKKAYDTVNRSTLLNRLKEIGVSTKFLKAIKAIYENINYMIKTKHFTLEAISSNLGLKQGCPLSPLLFNLYINDLNQFLSKSRDSPTLQDNEISHFLYADDLVLLSNTKEGLQQKLNELTEFADQKDLTVSISKSKVMIFNKTGRKIKEHFTIKNDKLEIVNTFTYLGVEIMNNGSFTLGVKNLAIKAKKAMIPLYKTILQFQMPFSKCKLMFNSYVEPILMYNTENWSELTDKQLQKCKGHTSKLNEQAINATTTTSQLKFYKFMLGVNKSCPNMVVLGEIGDLPLQLRAYLIMLKYWDRIRNLDEDTLIKKAYMENISMNTNWAKTIQMLNVTLKLNEDPTTCSKSNMTTKFNESGAY